MKMNCVYRLESAWLSHRERQELAQVLRACWVKPISIPCILIVYHIRYGFSMDGNLGRAQQNRHRIRRHVFSAAKVSAAGAPMAPLTQESLWCSGNG